MRDIVDRYIHNYFVEKIHMLGEQLLSSKLEKQKGLI